MPGISLRAAALGALIAGFHRYRRRRPAEPPLFLLKTVCGESQL